MTTSTGRRLFSVNLWIKNPWKTFLNTILTTTQRDTTCTMNYYYNSDVTTKIIQ